jgi:hypothetical protein
MSQPPPRPGHDGRASGPPPRPAARAAGRGAVVPSSEAPRKRRRTLWMVAIVLAVLLLVVAGAAIAGALGSRPATTAPAPASSGPTASAPPPASPSATSSVEPSASPPADPAAVARAQLAGLAVVSGTSATPYRRAAFGDPWIDVDDNGCDTRNDILARDLLNPVFRTGGCKVLSGILIDPYDGQRVDFVSGPTTSPLVQIDHVVALAWAWRHGAEDWTAQRRIAFANDPANLVAASEAMNQEKGADGPSRWLPPVRELRCGYVERWIGVLAVYRLGIDKADRAAADAVLRTC